MVEVKINDESFAYDIHSLIQAFYGGEEVQVRVGDAFTEEVPVQMAVQVTDQDISFSIIQNGAFQEKGHVYVENPDRKAVKNQLKRLMYDKLCAFTGETRQADGTHLLHTTRGDFHTRWVVNSAGLNSAVVSGQLGIPGYVIKPVKGEYFVLDKLAGQFAKIPVYPAPNPDNTFDTHATPTVDGNVLVGPDSQLARDFQDYESTQAAMDGLIESGSRMFKHMDRAYFIRNFAGIRPKRIDPATGAVQDFVLE